MLNSNVTFQVLFVFSITEIFLIEMFDITRTVCCDSIWNLGRLKGSLLLNSCSVLAPSNKPFPSTCLLHFPFPPLPLLHTFISVPFPTHLIQLIPLPSCFPSLHHPLHLISHFPPFTGPYLPFPLFPRTPSPVLCFSSQ